MSTRRLEVNLIGDPSSLSRAFGKVQQDTAKMAGGFSKLGATVKTVVGAYGIGQVVRGFVAAGNAASGLAEQVSKSGQVFEGASAPIVEWSKKTASSIGISQLAALEATGTFGNMLVPLGVAPQKAAVMSRSMVELAADMASFNDASPEDVLEALRSGLAGETEPLRRYGISLNDARLKQEALTLGIYKGTGTLTAAQKAQASYSLIVKDSAKAQGDFARTSDGQANQQRILNAEWEDAQAALGQKFLPVMIAATGALRDGIEFARQHGEALQTLAAGLAVAGGAALAYSGAIKAVSLAQALTAAKTTGLTAALGLNPVALAAAAGAAVVLGGAYLVLRGDASQSEEAIERMTDANRAAADAHRSAADAARAQADAVLGLKGAALSEEETALRLEEAQKRVTEALKEHGPKSVEYRRALLDERRAELDAARAKSDRAKAGEDVVAATQKSNKATRDEVAAARAAVVETEKKTLAVRLGVITGKDAEKAARAHQAAEKRLASATRESAVNHARNADKALAAADAMGGATPKAQALRRQLLLLADVEIDRSIAGNIAAIGSAASTALQGVNDLYARLANAPSLSNYAAVTGRGGGSGGKGAPASGGGGQKADSLTSFALPSNPTFALARVPVGSATDLGRVRGRGDRNAEAARRRAESAARRPGVSEEDITQAGERAWIKARTANLKNIRTRINARRKKLIRDVKKFDINARRKVKVPGPRTPEKRQAALDRRARMKESERAIRDELETLSADYADAAAQLAELGEQSAALDRADEAEAAAAADEASEAAAAAGADAPTEADFLDAATAQAALTETLDDDLSAAFNQFTAAGHAYNAASASGDPRRIAETARALLAAKQELERLQALKDNTDAVNANTDQIKQAFGGSTVFGYRGQEFALRSLAPPSSDRLVDAAVGL